MTPKRGNKKKGLKMRFEGFPSGLVVKKLPANAGDRSLIPRPGRFHRLQGNKARAFTTARDARVL